MYHFKEGLQGSPCVLANESASTVRRITELFRYAMGSDADSPSPQVCAHRLEIRSNPEFLNGWKEIAGFLGRSVRTVQRWEKLFDLPVHRPSRLSPGVVIASRAEIRDWVLGEVNGRKRNEREANVSFVERAKAS